MDCGSTARPFQAQAQHDYLSLAFARANALGADIAAFDAPKARAVPAGFDFALARRQTGNFLRIAQGHAAQAKLHIAVMNYRRAECNLINTISEAALMAALLQLENVGVLADTVQMALASESLDAVERAGSSLMYVHAGCALKRTLPKDGDGEDYRKAHGAADPNGLRRHGELRLRGRNHRRERAGGACANDPRPG